MRCRGRGLAYIPWVPAVRRRGAEGQGRKLSVWGYPLSLPLGQPAPPRGEPRPLRRHHTRPCGPPSPQRGGLLCFRRAKAPGDRKGRPYAVGGGCSEKIPHRGEFFQPGGSRPSPTQGRLPGAVVGADAHIHPGPMRASTPTIRLPHLPGGTSLPSGCPKGVRSGCRCSGRARAG